MEHEEVHVPPATVHLYDDKVDVPTARNVDELVHKQLATVQRLQSVYMVEYWRLLEKLRSCYESYAVEGHGVCYLQDGAATPDSDMGLVSLSLSATGYSEPNVVHKVGLRAFVQAKRAKLAHHPSDGQGSAENGLHFMLPSFNELIPTPTSKLPQLPVQSTSSGNSLPGASFASWGGPTAPAVSPNQSVGLVTVPGGSSTPSSRGIPTSLAFRSPQNLTQDLTQQGEKGSKPFMSTPFASKASRLPETPLECLPATAWKSQLTPDWKYGDDILGHGSDDDIPCYSDVEESIVDMYKTGVTALSATRSTPEDTSKTIAPTKLLPWDSWQSRFNKHRVELHQLEAAASTAAGLELDGEGAVASLCGRHGRYVMRRSTFSLGRSTHSKGEVDVDLALEGPSSKVSRRQALVTMELSGQFKIINIGRRKLRINNTVVTQFQTAELQHLSIIEVGGVALLFIVNSLAVQRVVQRSGRFVA